MALKLPANFVSFSYRRTVLPSPSSSHATPSDGPSKAAARLVLRLRQSSPDSVAATLRRSLRSLPRPALVATLRYLVHQHEWQLALPMYLSLLDAPWFTWNAEMHAEIVALLTSSKQLAQAQHLLESVDENLSVKQRLYFNRMLIHQYARFHLRDEVMCVFEYLQALSPSSVGPSSLTSLLHAYAIMDLPHEALAILRKMQQQMLNPSLNDFKAVLFSLGKCDMFPEMEMLAAEMNEVNMLNNLAVYNMLITTYASAENHGKVKDWLHRLLMAGLNPSVRTLNAIAKACRVLIQVSCSKTFVKAGVLSEYLRTKGAKDGELEIVELLLELCPIDEVVTWGSRWELDLHSTNMESAYILLCCWFEEVSKKLDIKLPPPFLLPCDILSPSMDPAGTYDDWLPVTDDTSMDPAIMHEDLLTLTENKSATFCSSANPCVDFFFQIVPDTPADRTISLLEQAWVHDSLTCLKLVCHLRGVRGTGKSNQQAFYTCASWLHQCHPQTLIANLHLVPKFGYYKDLLEIVLREIEGPDEVQKRLEDKTTRKRKIQMAKSGGSRRRRSNHDSEKKGYWARKGKAAREAKKAGVLQDREVRIAIALEKDKMAKETASQLRRQKRKDMAGRVENKLRESPRFAALYNAVAEIFAKQLQDDMTALNSDNLSEISFAAKWCPSQGKSYDLRTSLYQKVAELIFCNGECMHLHDEMPAVAMTDKLRTEFLVPLRRALELPEIYMSANRWTELPYERVPSVAMTNYVDQFVKHDNDRYLQYLEKVASGKKKVAAGALLPHDVARAAVKEKGKPKGFLAEAQWKRMINDLKESGSNLGSSMAVCDVSGSMSGTPMEVCIALGLLVAELSEEPFKNKICTFSHKPQVHLVQGETLAERYTFTSAMDWGMNTDFQKIFRLILDLAIASDLPKEKMVKRLFVFSDMEFDEASANPWETDYMMITKMFEESGYGEPPEIVFWNLRDSLSTPVLCDQKGVALVSGFSKNMLKIFLDGNTDLEEGLSAAGDGAEKEKPMIDPEEAMKKAIAGELFEDLRVID